MELKKKIDEMINRLSKLKERSEEKSDINSIMKMVAIVSGIEFYLIMAERLDFKSSEN